MKKSIIICVIVMAAAIMACEPIVIRDTNGTGITADQLNVTATPIVVNGKNSNKIVLNNASPVCSSWDYGLGVSQRANDTVLMVITGSSTIVFTGLNPDGTKISKTLTVTVDQLTFAVPAQWGYFCGTGAKTWVWDDVASSCWGNGGYLGCTAPCWWTLKPADLEGQRVGEGAAAQMIFSVTGASLTKKLSTGSSVKGSFSFDMTKTTLDGNNNIWGTGKLNTKSVTVLCGFAPNGAGKPDINSYDILLLNNTNMVLGWPEPGAGSWGTAWFWLFKAK